MTRIEVFSKSAPGSLHPYEDRVLVNEKSRLYAVADGVTLSSQGSGGVAAERTLALLNELFSGDLAEAVHEVHRNIFELRKVNGTIGETTLTAACLRDADAEAEIVNVGDSPAYLLRDGDLSILTRSDWSPLGYVAQVIGYPERITPHSKTVGLRVDDFLILASDGVGHVLNRATILPIVAVAEGSRDLAESIVMAARDTWTTYDDDKSVIVIKVSPGGT